MHKFAHNSRNYTTTTTPHHITTMNLIISSSSSRHSSCTLLALLMALCALVTASSAAPMGKSAVQHPARNKYAGLMYSMGAFKRKLQEQGLINSIDDEPYDSLETADYAHFNEFEMLQLIPVIISELQQRHIEEDDQRMLRAIFGSLWDLIVEEAQRRQRKRAARSHGAHRHHQHTTTTTIDPVLKSILRAQRDHDQLNVNSNALLASGAVDEHGMAAKLAKLWNEQNNYNVEPSQRILKLAAVLIHEQVQRKQTRAQRRAMRRTAAAATLMALTESELTQQQQQQQLELSSGESLSLEEEALLEPKWRLRNMRHKRATAAAASVAVVDESPEPIEGNDEDYAYGDEENVAADVAAAAATESDGEMFEDGEEADIDPTLLALRGDDEQLLRHMHGSAALRDETNSGSVSELFALAAEHRRRQRQNRNYLRHTVGGGDDDRKDGDQRRQRPSRPATPGGGV